MTRKRIFLFYGAFLAVLLVATYVVLRETGVSRVFVENLLARVLVRERFRLERANVDLGGGTVTLRGFEVASSDGAPAPARLAVDRVEVGVSTNPLGDVGAVRRVRVERLHLSLDISDGRAPDLGELFLAATPERPRRRQTTLPPIQVLDSRISLRISPSGEPIDFTGVNLELLPEATDGTRVVLSGTMVAPDGYRVTVSGGGDVATAGFRAQLVLDDVPLSPDIARPYSSDGVDFLRSIGIGGRARRVAIWVEQRPVEAASPADATVTAGVNLDLDDVSCALPQLPYPLVGASARISANTRANGSVKFRISNRSIDGDVDANGSLTGVFAGAPLADVQIRARDVLVGPALGRALMAERHTAEIWTAFEPSGGRADADVYLENDEPGRPMRAALDLTLRGVGARYVGFLTQDGERRWGFPLPLRDVTGQIQLRDRVVHVHDVRATSPAGDLSIDGSVVRTPAGTAVDLDLQSREMRFGDEVREALEVLLPGLSRTYDEYGARGAAALDVRLRLGPGHDRPGAYVHIEPLAASATWAGFPVRVDGLRGAIDIGPDGIRFDLSGDRGGRALRLDGRFLHSDDPEVDRMSAELWIDAKQIAFDREVRAALEHLSPSVGRTCDFLGLEATADCEVSLWRDRRDEQFRYDIRVDLLHGNALLENLHVPIRELRGPVFIHGAGATSRVDVSTVRGRIENRPGQRPADVLVQGTVHVDRDGYAMDVTSVVRHLQLTDEIGDAMDRNGTFDLATWRVLRPDGYVDVVSRQTRRLGQDAIDHQLRLQLDGVSSSAAILPAPALGMYGEVVVEAGEARFQDIRGTMAGAAIHCSNGYARHVEGASEFAATVSADDFPVDDRLANLMAGPLAKTYRDRQVRGAVKIDELNLHFRFPDEQSTFESRIDGRFFLRDVSFVLGTAIEDVDGLWSIGEGLFRSDGGSISGTFDNGALTILGHRVSGIDASFDADQRRFAMSSVAARVHNGFVEGKPNDDGSDLVYEFGDPGVLRSRLAWRDVSLGDVLRARGMVGDAYQGNLSGELDLEELVGARFIDMRGSGHVQIGEGRLGEVPIFTAIYSYLAPRRRPRFDSGRIDFRVGDRRISLDRVELSSSLLTAQAEGSIDMDGYIRMLIDFPDFFGKAADWLVLPQVIRALTSKVVRFDVYGYLRNPQARPRWLWQGEPPREPIGPIPAWRPRRNTFDDG